MSTAYPASPGSRPTRTFAQNAGHKVKRFFAWTIGIILVALIGYVLFVMFGTYGEGFRVGTVVKLAKKGVVFKTWEGELMQDFLENNQDQSSGGSMATKIWYFTVPSNDDQVRESIDQAIVNSKKVKLFYREKYKKLPWSGDTRQLVYKVEQIN